MKTIMNKTTFSGRLELEPPTFRLAQIMNPQLKTACARRLRHFDWKLNLIEIQKTLLAT